MTAFFEMFQPGLRHLREERDRQNTLVTPPTHGGGPPLGIDLDAGTATISISRRNRSDRRPVAEADSESDARPEPPAGTEIERDAGNKAGEAIGGWAQPPSVGPA